MRGQSGGAVGTGILGNAISVMPIPDNRPRGGGTVLIDESDDDDVGEGAIDNRPPLVSRPTGSSLLLQS